MSIPLSAAITPGGAFPVVDGGGQKIVNVANPTGPQEVATKAYVDRLPITVDNFWINPAGGSDSNDGLTSLTPFATVNALINRWGQLPILRPIGGAMVVHVMSSALEADAISAVDWTIDQSTVAFVGVPTTVRSGTITTVVSQDVTVNHSCNVTDSGMSGNWTANLHFRVRIVGGPRDGAIAWVAEDLGSKTARMTAFSTLSALGASGAEVSVQVGDAYVVESLPSLNVLAVSTKGTFASDGSFIGGNLFFVDLTIPHSPFIFNSPLDVEFIHCNLPNGMFLSGSSSTWSENSLLGASTDQGAYFYSINSTLGIDGGLLTPLPGGSQTYGYAQGGSLNIFGNLMCHGINDIIVENGTQFDLESAAFFNCPHTQSNVGCVTGLGGVTIRVGFDGDVQKSSIWGSGNAQSIVSIEDGNVVVIGAVYATTSAVDFNFGDDTTRVLGFPWSTSTASFSPGVATTWANLNLYGSIHAGALPASFLLSNGSVVDGPGDAVTQPDWFIDDAGDDANDGFTSLTALKTWDGLRARWGARPVLRPTGGVLTLTVNSDIPLTGDLVLSVDESSIIIQGSPTVVRTGTLTGVVSMNDPTNQPWTITDSAMAGTWTADIDHRVKIVGGANDGSMAYVAQDLGSKTAMLSALSKVATPFDALTASAATNGDTYHVESVTKVSLGTISIKALGDNGLSGVYFYDLDLQGTTFLVGNQVYLGWSNCRFSSTFFYSTNDYFNYMQNCSFVVLQCTRTFVSLDAGLVRGGGTQVSFINDSDLELYGDVMLHSIHRLRIVDNGFLGVFRACAFNSGSGAGVIEHGGSSQFVGGGHEYLLFADPAQGPGRLWGSGNTAASACVAVRAGGALRMGFIPTIAGTADFTLDNLLVGRTWNEAGGIYGIPVATTWANVNTYGNLWDVKTGANVSFYQASPTYGAADTNDLSLPYGAFRVRKGQVRTTSATPAAIAQYVMLNESQAAYEVIVTGVTETTATNSGRWKFSVVYKRTAAGVATIVGSLDTSTVQRTAGASAWAPTINTDGANTVRAMAVGVAATNIRWTVEMRIQETFST